MKDAGKSFRRTDMTASKLEKAAKDSERYHAKKDRYAVGTPEWEHWNRRAWAADNQYATEKQRLVKNSTREPEDVLTEVELAWRNEALAASHGETLNPPQPRKVSELTELYQRAVSAFKRGSYTGGSDLLEKADSLVGIDTDSRMQVRGKNMMKNARGSVADEDAARELVLFTTNDGALWGPGNTQGAAIRQNLDKKIKSGKLDLTKVPKLFEYLMTSASNAYAKEFGSRGDTGSSMFNAATRRLAAKEMAQEYLDELAYTTPNGRALPVAMNILGRRWRDSSGSTYHTVVIIFETPDGAVEELETDKPEYGYGDQYMQTALEMLVQEGVVPPPVKGTAPWRHLREDLGIPLQYRAEDVKRKKDL